MKSIWMFNYYIVMAENKQNMLRNLINMLKVSSPIVVCQTLEKMLCYYDLFDIEMKNTLVDYIEKMQVCVFCRKCCRDFGWWNNLRKVVYDFEEMTRDDIYLSECELYPSAAIIVPDHLSANSFLQPPVDTLMVVRQLVAKNISYEFIDNRLEKLNPVKLYSKIKGCEYVVITSTPYDHIQNYFLDYRLKYVFLLVSYIKKCDPRKKVILCGAHGSVRPDIVFRECDVDYIIRGEYDFLIDDVIEKLMNNQSVSSDYVVARNDFMTYKQDDFVHDVDSYLKKKHTVPYYKCIDFSRYFGDVYIDDSLQKTSGYAAILASRGCTHKCNFCFNFFGQKVRYRNPENVVDEMLYMQQSGVKGIYFMDSTFTQNRDWTWRVCEEIVKRDIKIPWSAETRCDCVDNDLLQMMSKANCRALWFGVESFCSRVLKINNKYFDSGIGYKAIQMCRNNNIQPLQFIMIGAPGESMTSLNDTINELGELGESYVENVMVATPRFGTGYYQIAKKQYEYLGNDFYSLNGVRGMISNEMTPKILNEAIARINNRDFRLLHG